MPDQQTQAPVEETTGTVTPEQETASEEHRHGGAGEGSAVASPGFTREEIAQLESDDSHAGSVIGKMLAFFFLYTVVVMAIVGWLTVQGYLG